MRPTGIVMRKVFGTLGVLALAAMLVLAPTGAAAGQLGQFGWSKVPSGPAQPSVTGRTVSGGHRGGHGIRHHGPRHHFRPHHPHRGHHHRGHHRGFRSGVFVGSSIFLGAPFFHRYYHPYYDYPYVSAPPVVIQEPPVYIQQQPPAAAGPAEGYWYYCQSAGGYYPTVPTCPEAWILVVPRAE